MAIQIHFEVVDENENDENIQMNERLTCCFLNQLLNYIVPIMNQMNNRIPLVMKMLTLTNWQQLDSNENFTNAERKLLRNLVHDVSKHTLEIINDEIKNNKSFREIGKEKAAKMAQDIADEAIKKAMKD